ncbi:hypothetical protein KQI68_02020 [Peptoniphilus sp. MSJ-1]|uniref:Uncharacterized protein n=1 Tax=Peptoniphilus ovalis TaxID=2841503 RepID=A0ABS6FH98_9FIRM|nr:hypothetical protein [Peptoniphilus ovalis]MBU5668610.1 hypothetical protein [Peptoniphilus ovalis]
MNREYRIIGIAMGRLKANECGIILTEEDKKVLKKIKRWQKNLRKKKVILFSTHLLIWIKK